MKVDFVGKAPSCNRTTYPYIGRYDCRFKAPLRLATWTIRACLGTDFHRDPSRVLQGIAVLQADIVALQEADFRLGSRPSALPRDRIVSATGLHALPIGRNAVSLGWHGNALLARPEFDLCALSVQSRHLMGWIKCESFGL
jgi:endonuclease/exonuclease/phosphatase family metal-dependent hydrolase